MVDRDGFLVHAGTFVDGEEDCKFTSDWVDTLGEAMELMATCDDYTYSQISYYWKGKGYVVDVYPYP